MGEMKCIFDVGKKISLLVKVTQVSIVAHGPLVLKSLFSREPASQFQSYSVQIILGLREFELHE